MMFEQLKHCTNLTKLTSRILRTNGSKNDQGVSPDRVALSLASPNPVVLGRPRTLIPNRFPTVLDVNAKRYRE